MRSSFVSTPSVRSEFGSTSFATRTPSLVAMSALAADTATMTTFLLTMNFLAIFSMSATVDAGWSAVATFVRPGMSTSVRLGAPAARMDSMIGSAETAFLWPFDCKDRSVSRSISARTSRKSVKTVFGLCRNRADATSDAGAPCSCSTSGRRVHIPAPRGKKSLPTMASSTLDLPLLWPPTTTIWGSVSHSEGSFEALPEASGSATSPASAHASCSLLTSRRRGSMGVGSAADDASAICASRDIAACAVKWRVVQRRLEEANPSPRSDEPRKRNTEKKVKTWTFSVSYNTRHSSLLRSNTRRENVVVYCSNTPSTRLHITFLSRTLEMGCPCASVSKNRCTSCRVAAPPSPPSRSSPNV